MDAFNIHRIVVPSDLEQASDDALAYARLFAERFSSTVSLVYADPVLGPLSFFQDRKILDAFKDDGAPVEKLLRDQAQSRLGSQVSFDVHIVKGAASPMIVETATALGADMIIVGTRHRLGWSRTACGSLTYEILHAASCPVLTIRPDRHPRPPQITRILCPVNMTSVARDSIRAAAELAARFHAELVVVHVVEDEKSVDAAQPSVRSWLERSGVHDANLRDLVMRGGAAERVLDCVEDLNADLLVIGAQQKFFDDVTVIGTTTERLLHFSNCPVFTVFRRAEKSVAEPGREVPIPAHV